MQNNNLPTDELKTFGIINEDLTFSKKLSEDDIQKFLQGYTIVADNDKNRATFQLTDNNTKLKVIFLERDKSLSEIIKNSKETVQYTDIKDLSKSPNELDIQKKAFIFDRENGKTVEFDFIKNARELTAIIADKNDPGELKLYKNELLKLKVFLQDKIERYPEITKEITNDMNIVSREINSVNSIVPDEKQISKGGNSDIQLNVNDRDMYEDANRNREQQEEQSEEQEKKTGIQKIDHSQNFLKHRNTMENELSWFDRVITPKTKTYKDFVKEMENTSSEIFFKDGERKFTDKEKKFMQIYRSGKNGLVIGSAFTVKTIFNSNPDFPVHTNFKSLKELLHFIDQQKADAKVLVIQNNTGFSEVTIDNEASKQKLLSDIWAKELGNRTDLSSGLTYTQIDERQAYHYRNYEMEAKKTGIEVNPFTEGHNESNKSSRQLYYEEHNLGFDDLFSKEDFDENLTPASGLPDGWIWWEYDDGSGSLRSPSGHSYYSYDLQTQEYRLPYNKNEWTSMKDFFDRPQTLHDFKSFAEQDLKGKAARNDLSPKLSEDEKNDLLNYRTLMKENEFVLEKLQITQQQKAAYAEKAEFGTTSGDYSLTQQQLDIIPDVLDGHQLSKNDKYELAFGSLEKHEYGESYELLENGEILKTYLDEDTSPKYRILTVNDINFNNQNPDIMETQKEFDQVKYLKDQLKYLGFGEGEQLHKDLEKRIRSRETQFEIKTSSDKTLPENKVNFLLRFNKTDSGGVFFNSYHAILNNEKNETVHHKFQVNKENTFTAKEAVNLLEGRSVKIEFDNPKSKQKETAFVQFDFNHPKTENGNYYFQNFYEKYGVDTSKIVEKSNLVFDNPEWKENTIKSLEKGNVVKIKFQENDETVEGKAVLDPQNRNLKLYDKDMNRLNTNKPLEGLENDQKHEKANVKEQSIKR